MPPAVRYVVSRLNWRESAGIWCRLPGDTRMASFESADDAAADRTKREQAARQRVNPFQCGTAWHERTAMPELIFRDYLQDADIAPPDESTPWDKWWEAVVPTLTADLKARVWEGLTGLRFYTVEERPNRPVAYAVVRINWQYNDQWYYPDAEGGTVETLYRTRKRALAEVAERTEEEREYWRGGNEDAERFEFDMEGRRFAHQDPFDPSPKPPKRDVGVDPDENYGHFSTGEVPFFEVIEVELEEVTE